MSALAGIFKFDATNLVSKSALGDLSRGIDRLGPDGGTEHISCNLGMTYRAFHTTPESHSEVQPFVRNGCVLTWDGRLDNREEIRARVRRKFDRSPTDVDLVFEAYQEWGASCFAELIGDWALALWDDEERQLILARDYIGVRRLFYRLDQDGLTWCTAMEPLVLTASRALHLDLDYVAGYFYPRPSVETTPYREIGSVIPGSFLTFHNGGKRTVVRYWSLDSYAPIRCSSDAEYEEQFKEVFRQSIKRRLRTDRPLLAELSGGIDSSSVVCVADDLLRPACGPVLETLSYYDTDEPGGDERPYFSVIEEARRRTGHHIDLADFNRCMQHEAISPLSDESLVAAPGCFAKAYHWACLIDQIATETSSRIILSGIGGDELLGGVQYEATELAECVAEGRLYAFARSLFNWSMARKKPMLQLLGDVVGLFAMRSNPDLAFSKMNMPVSWVSLKPIARHRSLNDFSSWIKLTFNQFSSELARYALSSQLTCTGPPLVGCIERRYPYLDRDLYTFMASIPRSQVICAKQRRSLMRRSLRGVVPDSILLRKTKWFGTRSAAASVVHNKLAIRKAFEEPWISDGPIVNVSQLQSRIFSSDEAAIEEAPTMIAAVAFEQWLRSCIRNGSLSRLSLGDCMDPGEQTLTTPA